MQIVSILFNAMFNKNSRACVMGLIKIVYKTRFQVHIDIIFYIPLLKKQRYARQREILQEPIEYISNKIYIYIYF
jgi:hypothetical protein